MFLNLRHPYKFGGYCETSLPISQDSVFEFEILVSIGLVYSFLLVGIIREKSE